MHRINSCRFPLAALAYLALTLASGDRAHSGPASAAQAEAKTKAEKKKQRRAKKKNANKKSLDAKNTSTGKTDPPRDPELAKYAIFAKTAPRAAATKPAYTKLPLVLGKGDRIAYIGNTLLDRAGDFGHFEALMQQRFAGHNLVVRNLSWSADTPDLQPRPTNFADVEQHLAHEKIDVIFAAFGFNESFAGEAGIAPFRKSLSAYIARLKSRAFNGKSGPRIVLVSPIANENVTGVAAADMNNARIAPYVEVMQSVAAEQRVGFAEVFTKTREAMADENTDLTFNGAHLVDAG